MAILKIKNENGEFINIPSIVGPKGDIGPQGIQGPQGEPGTTNYNELTNIPIIQLTGTKTNPVIIRNLNVGLYLITGYSRLYASKPGNSYSENPILHLIPYKNSEYSKCLSFGVSSYDNNACYIYKITNNGVTSYPVNDESNKIGNINLLKTTDKTSLVNAVNEVNAQIGDINTILATLTEVSE